MARPRWMRHKLLFGLAVVVAMIGLLFCGTLYGINAYMATVRTTERKLEELKVVTVVIKTLKGEDQPPADIAAQHREFALMLETVRGQMHYYQHDLLAGTVARGLDPDGGHQETKLIDHLDRAMRQMDDGLKAARQPTLVDGPKDAAVREAYTAARRAAEELRIALMDDIETSIRRSNASIRQSLWIVVSATVWAVLLAVALLYYSRVWLTNPLKALQAGVQRVHGGDFDHPIVIRSRDELEDLANEFNAMTTRLSAVYKDLARQVNERSRQLVRSERMVSVGFLAAGVAHEINNPLASILFCSEALERRLADAVAHAPPSEAEVLTRYLKMIQQEALRCKEITTKLLDFSRTGERKREPTDLGGLVQGVIEVARLLPNSRGKTITFNPDAYVVVPANGQDLKSVILNLVVNALDSMDDRGSLAVGLRATNEFAELAFADSGCGMTPDVLENIFEPFYTRSRTGKGTGLGLFISHQIIDQHGGTIQATSGGPGQGSTFVVRVPLREVQTGTEGGGSRADSTGPAVLPFPASRVAA